MFRKSMLKEERLLTNQIPAFLIEKERLSKR